MPVKSGEFAMRRSVRPPHEGFSSQRSILQPAEFIAEAIIREFKYESVEIEISRAEVTREVLAKN